MRTLAEITQRLRRTLRRKGQSSEQAEDIVQDAMLRFEVYRRDRPVRDEEAFITRTAFNLAIDAGRRTRRSPISGEDHDLRTALDPAPDQVESLIARRSLEWMKEGLAVMEPKTRAMLLAHRLDEQSYAEIARREGVSETAVIKRVARGVVFLQKWMDKL
jgi:RNA polymerase sigma-70 factor (ECF subfamily)